MTRGEAVVHWDVVGRVAKGFAAGVLVGALWALWAIRRRRAEPVGRP